MDGDAVRARLRVMRSTRLVDATRTSIKDWLANRQSCPVFTRFTNHFNVLDQVLSSMLDAIIGELAAIGDDCPPGEVYERCAQLDRSLAIVVRLFEWYSSRYDQRLDDKLAPILRAADEVVRSCWSEPFALLGGKPPTGPLVYLEVQFDAFATPRVSIPPDLRAPADLLVAEYLHQLPVPTIALPMFATREAWWLALIAHETGHHVQKDLASGLESVTLERLASAVAATSSPGLIGQWSGWGLEAFADAYSILMVGAAAVWAIDELQYATPGRLFQLARPGGRYPSPAVRLALLGECLNALGAQGGWPTAAEVSASLDRLDDAVVPAATRDTIRNQLATVPAVAAALIDLPIGPHRLRELGNVQPDLLTQPKQLRGWAAKLAGANPVLPALGARSAARLLIAAGVAAYQTWADQPVAASVLPVINDNLLALLPGCGPPGVLEAPPRPADVAALAARLSAQLLRETPDEEDQ